MVNHQLPLAAKRWGGGRSNPSLKVVELPWTPGVLYSHGKGPCWVGQFSIA